MNFTAVEQTISHNLFWKKQNICFRLCKYQKMLSIMDVPTLPLVF